MATVKLKDLAPTLKAKANSLSLKTLPTEIAKLVEIEPIKSQPLVVAAMNAIAAGMAALEIAKQAAVTIQKLQPAFKTASDVIGAGLNPAMIPEIAMNAASPILGANIDVAIKAAVQGAVDALLNTEIEIPD